MLKISWKEGAMLLLLAFVIFFIAFSKLSSPSPIKIGFLGPITGKYGDLGLNGRNGAILAVDYINARGGVHKRPLEMIVEDTKGTAYGSVEAFKRLLSYDVAAIIGPMLSVSAIAIKPLIDKYQIPVISPTVSTSLLSKKRDSFFRVMNDNTVEASEIALFAIKFLDKIFNRPRKWCVVYDLGNPEYVLDLLKYFKQTLRSYSDKDKVCFQIGYVDEKSGIPESVYTKLQELSFDALLIIVSAIDGAQLINWISDKKPEIFLFGTTWMASEELLKRLKQDHAITYVLQQFPIGQSSRIKSFTRSYKHHYGHNADYSAYVSYEATMLVYEALKKSLHTGEPFLKAIANIRNCSRTFWPLNLDQYGDAHRACWICQIKQKNFYPVQQMCYYPFL